MPFDFGDQTKRAESPLTRAVEAPKKLVDVLDL